MKPYYGRISRFNERFSEKERWLLAIALNGILLLSFLFWSLISGKAISTNNIRIIGLALIVNTCVWKGLFFPKIKLIQCPYCDQLMHHGHDLGHHIQDHAEETGPITVKVTIYPRSWKEDAQWSR